MERLLLLVFLLPVYSRGPGLGPTGEPDFAGTTLAYYPKYYDKDQRLYEVELRIKTNGGGISTPEWLCAGGECINYFEKSSYDVDPNSRAEFRQREDITTRFNRGTAPYLLKVFRGPYYGWVDSLYGTLKVRALALVDMRNRSDSRQQNRSPQTAILPVFRVPWNCQREIRLLAYDPDGDQVKCRFADNSIHPEECDPCTPPSVLHLSPTCSLSFNRTDSSSVGWYAVQLMMEDFPRTNIILTDNNYYQEVKLTSNSISKMPVQFIVTVGPAAPFCTEGLYLPKFVEPTPEHGAQLSVNVNQTLQITIKAEATESVTTELVFSGPHNMAETKTEEQFILSWTPSAAEDGQSHPVCFSVEAVLGTIKYQSELRCVIMKVGNGN